MTDAGSGVRMVLVVAAALVDGEGRVLLAQRPEGKALAGLWEFPGGKLDPGERPEAALARELAEEIGVLVSEADMEPAGFASHAYPDFHLLMPLWVVRRWSGEPAGREGQAIAWVGTDALEDWPMPPADGPLLPQLRGHLERAQ